MITNERMAEALDFLAGSDEDAAILRTEAERAKLKVKAVQDAVFLHSSGTVAERQAQSTQAQAYMDAQEHYLTVLEQADTMKNRRDTAELIVRAWQTVSSNRRQGQI